MASAPAAARPAAPSWAPVAASVTAVTLTTAGQTVPWLRGLDLLAPRAAPTSARRACPSTAPPPRPAPPPSPRTGT
ncbi:hypothetical protein [Kitasatospora albolonga]|uniref:hypothetical protein n=1 Tax=Kitasatospora albolonga TaxID=68173 RepID=UPI0031EB1299